MAALTRSWLALDPEESTINENLFTLICQETYHILRRSTWFKKALFTLRADFSSITATNETKFSILILKILYKN
jgi:hypothetical protein